MYELCVHAHRRRRNKIGLECLMLTLARFNGVECGGRPSKPSPCLPGHEGASLSAQSHPDDSKSYTLDGGSIDGQIESPQELMAKGSAHSWPGGADHADAASEGLPHVQTFCPIWASLLHGIKLQVRAGEGYPASLAGAMSRLWGRPCKGADHARNPFFKT